jgi:hypothetical protein
MPGNTQHNANHHPKYERDKSRYDENIKTHEQNILSETCQNFFLNGNLLPLVVL